MFSVFKTSGIEGSYSVSSNPLFVSGECWTVYPAKHRTTKKKASVWQFSKRDYENMLSREGVIGRTNRELVLGDIYANLRAYISNLARLHHPNFLTVIEPLEEHKSRLLFVTEYVANDLKSLDKADLDEISITKGLLQVATGLKFLHQSVSTVHLNINPSSIVITENFDWKISGLQFSQQLENGPAEKYIDPMDARMPRFLSVDFRFSSPNLLLRHQADYIDDLFSVGCLIYYLFNAGTPLIECSNSSLLDYERSFNKVKRVLDTQQAGHPFFEAIPENYKQVLVELLRRTQESSNDVIELQQPYTVDEFMASQVFDNKLVRLLNVVDEFQALDGPERVRFLSSLRSEIAHFPKPLLINKFMPLLADSVKAHLASKKKLEPEDEQIVALGVENLLLLSPTLSQLTFSDNVFPVLTGCLNTLDLDPVKSLLLSHLDTIRKELGVTSSSGDSRSSAFRTFLITLFEKSCSSTSTLPASIKLQETLLQNVRTFIEYEPYSVLTGKLFPATCTLFSTTTSLKVKILTVKAFVLMVNGADDKSLDNYALVEKLLPLIRKTQPGNFRNPDLLGSMVTLYSSIFSKLRSASGKISVGKAELKIPDLVMDLVYFEAWRMTRVAAKCPQRDALFELISTVEAYLRTEVEKNAPEPTARAQTPSSVPSRTPTPQGIPKSVTPKPAAVKPPMKPTVGLRKASPSTAYTPLKSKPAAKSTVSHMKLEKSNPLHFGATSTNSPLPPTPHYGTPVASPATGLFQTMKATKRSAPSSRVASPTTATATTTLDWSRVEKAKPTNPPSTPSDGWSDTSDWGNLQTSTAQKPTAASNGWTLQTPASSTPTPKPATDWSSGSLMQPIKPTKRMADIQH